MHKRGIADMSIIKTRVCPWWGIHSFDNPLRQLVQNPERILGDLVRPGDRCLDVGCGYGYFTVALARLVGPTGSVVAVDIQPEMLKGVRRRAEAQHLTSRIQPCQADASGLRLEGVFDFALAFWMVHEVPDQKAVLAEICGSLKEGGRFLMVEPKLHVGPEDFRRTIEIAESVGFTSVEQRRIFFSRSLLMSKTMMRAA